jgi:hypothetical protein
MSNADWAERLARTRIDAYDAETRRLEAQEQSRHAAIRELIMDGVQLALDGCPEAEQWLQENRELCLNVLGIPAHAN